MLFVDGVKVPVDFVEPLNRYGLLNLFENQENIGTQLKVFFFW